MISSEYCPHKYLFQTNDPEEAATQLGSRAVPYVSELLLGSPPFSTRIQSSGTDKVQISRVTTTGRMRVHACLPADSFALIVDLRTGVGLHRSGQGNVTVDSEFGFVQSRSRRLRSSRSPNSTFSSFVLPAQPSCRNCRNCSAKMRRPT